MAHTVRKRNATYEDAVQLSDLLTFDLLDPIATSVYLKVSMHQLWWQNDLYQWCSGMDRDSTGAWSGALGKPGFHFSHKTIEQWYLDTITWNSLLTFCMSTANLYISTFPYIATWTEDVLFIAGENENTAKGANTNRSRPRIYRTV